MKRRKTLVARDQAVSAFSGALMRLCDAIAAHGAALVDAEGETVDYAGSLSPFEIRVAAAEWRLQRSLGLAREFVLPTFSRSCLEISAFPRSTSASARFTRSCQPNAAERTFPAPMGLVTMASPGRSRP